ncbi:hypothetical protein BT63DRAFT_420545 [Microthyrium microscopicum]|uniref:Peroxisomal membrane protein Pex17 n=1 Tax=Microthyrium microscopicum TaxID=703497 RepID=A0A6A6UT88_9PEZI|nr:hypothetical protein BT63DRAFT_420545 [Microthyrium microscopicum]
MSADRLLGTLLRYAQTYTEQQDTPRFLSTAASLLVSLQNHRNITLLTSHLLSAPALWHRPEGLQTCLRLMGVSHSAALALLRREEQDAVDAQSQWYPPPSQGIPKNAWIKAVVKGATGGEDGTGRFRSPAWKSVLVLTGLLLGFGPREEEALDANMRASLEQELIANVNKALEDVRAGGEELSGHALCLALNHVFPHLSDFERSLIDYDLLLPVLIGSAFFSNEGLQGAYFLAAIELDLSKTPDGKLNWRPNSTSFHNVQNLLNRPLVASLGPLARLIAHSIENVRESYLVHTLVDDLAGFSRSLLSQWRQNSISNVDIHEEQAALSQDTIQITTPQLWKLLRSTLFALTIVFRGSIGRLLNDRHMASDAVAPNFVIQVLSSLRNLFFITSRIGTHSFSQYTFVYLTCIDILAAYPRQAEEFLQTIKPTFIHAIPASPVDRALALYFLNTAEHFTLILSPASNEDFLVASALPYLAAGGAKRLLPLFEAAHSVMLAVLSAPQSADTAAKHAPFYVDALFSAFPQNLSPRQFRLAFKTLMRVAAPPSPLAFTHPDLPAILLELVLHRGLHAPTEPLPQVEMASPLAGDDGAPPQAILSERAVLALTLLDALPFLPLGLLNEWLPLAAQLVDAVPPGPMREMCRARFWEVLVGGEMDPERALVCVSWCTSQGGMEMVMGGQRDQDIVMSGALPAPEAKL